MSRSMYVLFCILSYGLFLTGKFSSLLTSLILTTDLTRAFYTSIHHGQRSGEIGWLKSEDLLPETKTLLIMAPIVPTVVNDFLKVWNHRSNIMDNVLDSTSKGSFDSKLSQLRSLTTLTEVPSQTYWILPSTLKEYVHKLEHLKKEDCMNFEWGRYESFKDFPMGSPARPMRLASCGFFYTGSGDKVKCFSCNLEHSGWKDGDEPNAIHKMRSPNCVFVRRADNANVSIHQSPRNAAESHILQTDDSSGGACWTETASAESYKTNLIQREVDNESREELLSRDVISSDEGKLISIKAKEKLDEMGLSYSFEQVRKLVNHFKDIGQSLTTEFVITNLIENQENFENSEQVSRESAEVRKLTNQQNDNKSADNGKKVRTRAKNLTEDADELEKENMKLKNQLLCKICMDSNSTVVFIPCGHMVSCEKCGPNIRKCALCRMPIKGRVKTFMS